MKMHLIVVALFACILTLSMQARAVTITYQDDMYTYSNDPKPAEIELTITPIGDKCQPINSLLHQGNKYTYTVHWDCDIKTIKYTLHNTYYDKKTAQWRNILHADNDLSDTSRDQLINAINTASTIEKSVILDEKNKPEFRRFVISESGKLKELTEIGTWK